MSTRAKKPKLTAREGEWFRTRYGKVCEENRELREVFERFCDDLSKGGIVGSLLAKELRERVAKVRPR